MMARGKKTGGGLGGGTQAGAEMFEMLEGRNLFSAPVVGPITVTPAFPVGYEPFQLTVQPTDDTGVRAATFFIDRDDNGRFTAGVDEPLGDVFTADGQGRFSLTVQANSSWRTEPLTNVIADALDVQGNWSAQVTARSVRVIAQPLVVSHLAQFSFNPGAPINKAFEVRAKADEQLGTPSGIAGVTFFIDRDSNNVFSVGDTDLGASFTTDADGYYSRSGPLIGNLNGQVAAVAFVDSTFTGTRIFGPPVIRQIVEFPNSVPARGIITDAQWSNVTDPNRGGVEIFQRMRITYTARATANVAAVSLFYDTDFNMRWTPGVDVDLGGQFFGPGQTQVNGQFEFDATPNMNFDVRPFVLTVKDASGNSDTEWGPTYTRWAKIISPPWVDQVLPLQANYPVNGTITADFRIRDDLAVRSAFAFVDRNGDGIFQAGEASTEFVIRLTAGLSDARWRVTLNLSGLNYTPGTYQIGIRLTDFEGSTGRTTFQDVVLV
jgi:hypothetical protein